MHKLLESILLITDFSVSTTLSFVLQLPLVLHLDFGLILSPEFSSFPILAAIELWHLTKPLDCPTVLLPIPFLDNLTSLQELLDVVPTDSSNQEVFCMIKIQTFSLLLIQLIIVSLDFQVQLLDHLPPTILPLPLLLVKQH